MILWPLDGFSFTDWCGQMKSSEHIATNTCFRYGQTNVHNSPVLHVIAKPKPNTPESLLWVLWEWGLSIFRYKEKLISCKKKFIGSENGLAAWNKLANLLETPALSNKGVSTKWLSLRMGIESQGYFKFKQV